MVGGRAILGLDPLALRHLSEGHDTALVSATNGKTTTTALLGAALATRGPVVTNLAGANLPPGLAAALAEGPEGAPAALEVDEAWLGRVVDATQPKVVVLLNLSRDQLDRNNEVRRLSSSWRTILEGREDITVVANADDPLVVWGAGAAPDVRWVGAGQPWTADAAGCPRCGSRIVWVAESLPDQAGSAVDNATPGAPGPTTGDDPNVADVIDNPGWACSVCDLHRPRLDVGITNGVLYTSDGFRRSLQLALPGRANRANAAMAMTAARLFGIEPGTALDAMASTDEVVGRYRTVRSGAVEARLLLAKNPAGWLEVLDVLRPPPTPVVVAINSRVADGRDPSWLWDVPFEALQGRMVVASGERCADLAVRLHYAEVDHVVVADPVAAIAAAGANVVDVVGNYTSFQTVRAALA
ncbi:MAG: MurT ligase domain-containing protein [Actinomycetota bacterium]|nr:MurT ligase domain-containing protein [Actinomycetota bacterium]MDQ6945097.1 MurT ligase domain-containing protein [Actinomycetota bacterium]